MKSKVLIEKQLKTKNDKELVETIIIAKKNPNWFKVSEILSSPRKNYKEINLNELNKSEDEIIVVCGKVLSQGEISKKIKVVAYKFSEKAKEKLIKAGCQVETIINEIKKNPEAKGVKIL
ncbi:MAG: 50S ribosomal protein L18e [Candidatus Pacearchaeota archaeon]|nr:50S ribosomal protein L18e [Candidatus Pacearchaeota archaeon]